MITIEFYNKFIINMKIRINWAALWSNPFGIREARCLACCSVSLCLRLPSTLAAPSYETSTISAFYKHYSLLLHSCYGRQIIQSNIRMERRLKTTCNGSLGSYRYHKSKKNSSNSIERLKKYVFSKNLEIPRFVNVAMEKRDFILSSCVRSNCWQLGYEQCYWRQYC